MFVCCTKNHHTHTHRVNYIPARFITPSQKRELPEASHAWLPAKGQRGARRRANWQRTHEHVTAAEKFVPVCPSIRLTVVWFVLVLLLLLLPCHLIATAPKFLVSIRELLSLIGFQRDSSRWRNFCTFASCCCCVCQLAGDCFTLLWRLFHGDRGEDQSIVLRQCATAAIPFAPDCRGKPFCCTNTALT